MSSQGGGFHAYAKYSFWGNHQIKYSYKFNRIENNFRAQIWTVCILSFSMVLQMSTIWLNNKRVWPDYATVTDYRPTHTTVRNRKHRYLHNTKNTIKVKPPALSSSAILTCFEILLAAMQYLNIYFSFYNESSLYKFWISIKISWAGAMGLSAVCDCRISWSHYF